MADSSKLVVRGVFSNNSDPNVDAQADTGSLKFALSSPTQYIKRELSVPLAGYTIDLAGFLTSVDGVVIKNLDSTNFIDVEWTSSSTANKQKIPAGGVFAISDATIANDITLTSDTAICECEIFIAGV